MVRLKTVSPEGKVTLGPFIYSPDVAIKRIRKSKLKEREGTMTILTEAANFPSIAVWQAEYAKFNTQELHHLLRLVEAKWRQKEGGEEDGRLRDNDK